MTDDNPYASPATVDDSLAPRLAGDAADPLPPIRPRWWEIGLFAVLMSGLLLIAGFATYLTLTNEVPLSVPVNLVVLVVTSICLVTMLVGGIMALRVWFENGLDRMPPPGHGIMVAELLGSIISVAGGIIQASSYSLGSLFIFWGQVIIELGTVAICATLFVLMWRHAVWRWVGAIFLAIGTLQFGLWFFSADADFWMPREALSGGPAIVAASLWFFAALVTGIVALREHDQAVPRDWLHWTGVICWLLPIILTSVQKLVEELG